MAQRGLFAGIAHRFPFPCPSVKQPQCVMLKPEAGRDTLLFAAVRVPISPVRRQERGQRLSTQACSVFP